MYPKSSSATPKHSHQELVIKKLCTIILNQEDKLAELRHSLNTLAGGEHHASANQLKESLQNNLEKFEDSIEKLRLNVASLGGTPPPRRSFPNESKTNETKKEQGNKENKPRLGRDRAAEDYRKKLPPHTERKPKSRHYPEL